MIRVRRHAHPAPLGHLPGEFQGTVRKFPEEGSQGRIDLEPGFLLRTRLSGGHLPGLTFLSSLGRQWFLTLHELLPRSKKRTVPPKAQPLSTEELFHLLPSCNLLTAVPPSNSLSLTASRRPLKPVPFFSL